MSREAKANMQSVKSAIEQLQTAGETVTVRKIHGITGGDYNTVARLQKELSRLEIDRLSAPREVSALFDTLADDLYTKTRNLAMQEFEHERGAIRQKLAEAEAERDEAGKAVTELSARLSGVQHDSKDEMSRLQATLLEMQKERDEAREEVRFANASISDVYQQKADALALQKSELGAAHQIHTRSLTEAHQTQVRMIEEKNQAFLDALQTQLDEQKAKCDRLELDLKTASEKQNELSQELLFQSKATGAAELEIQRLVSAPSKPQSEARPASQEQAA
ncbi:DNA-binding protein [Shimia thalassica]|uniref:DNA-binding protein n=1 Tax=Shimia thalassica TaxID=1715693 RepID=UPI0027364D71|nr:DNA-binding protein [Shimia thalassica]MDP2582088.1 DNA-binding protein [Shimia thalassica]